MDNNDPANPNSSLTQPGAMPPVDPNASAQANPWGAPATPAYGQPTPVESLPGSSSEGRILNDTTGPVAGGATSEATWSNPQAPISPQPGMMPQTSFDQPQAPLPEPGAESAAPLPSTQNPMNNNPFLQPNAGTAFTMPQTPLPDPNAVAGTPPPIPDAQIPATPNPMVNPTPDPLNTAFSPTAAPPANPFGAPAAEGSPLPDPNVVAAAPPPAESPEINPPAPGAPATNPWDLPPMPTGAQQPADAIDPNTVTSSQPIAPTGSVSAELPQPNQNPLPNPILNMGQPGNMPMEEQTQPGGIPSGSQSGPLDLSTLQNNSTPGENGQPWNMPPKAPPGQQSPAAAPPPGTMPMPPAATDNAPTDLSHLIGGDEQSPGNGVYTPPVAADQNPAVTPVQTPTAAEGEAPPPGKHLNLTKVLLVAGIPIILIVAALSAYLILGVGQQAAPESTSLPVEQTTQTQAPLTNPPQQIVAPSPAAIPDPSAVFPAPSGVPTTLGQPSATPAGSLSPAMQAAQRQASPSPSGGVSVSPSPASSASTSLPLN